MRRVPPSRAALLPLSSPFSSSPSAPRARRSSRRAHPSSRAAHVGPRARHAARRALPARRRPRHRRGLLRRTDGPLPRGARRRLRRRHPGGRAPVRRAPARRPRVSPFAAPRATTRAGRWPTPSPRRCARCWPRTRAPPSSRAAGRSICPPSSASLRGQIGQFRRCYEDALRGDPSLRGRITVRFTVSVDGRVTEATAAADPAGLAPVGHCILGHLRTEAFPRPHEAAANFVFPFTFAPEDAGGARGSTASP